MIMMRRWWVAVSVVTAAAVTVVGCSAGSDAGLMAQAGPIAIPHGVIRCHARAGGQLPDPGCSPGSRNAAVSAATVRRTVCAPGWVDARRLPAAMVNDQLKSLMTAYGYGGMPLDRFAVAYVVPLEVGGSPGTAGDLSNLWPVPAGSKMPTTVALVRGRVCAGTMQLTAAQNQFRRDWRALGRTVGAL